MPDRISQGFFGDIRLPIFLKEARVAFCNQCRTVQSAYSGLVKMESLFDLTPRPRPSKSGALPVQSLPHHALHSLMYLKNTNFLAIGLQSAPSENHTDVLPCLIH